MMAKAILPPAHNEALPVSPDPNNNINRWTCVSPMTHHIFRESFSTATATTNLRKRRSRSFSDYIDSRNEQQRLLQQQQSQHGLSLPALHELQPPRAATISNATPASSSIREAVVTDPLEGQPVDESSITATTKGPTKPQQWPSSRGDESSTAPSSPSPSTTTPTNHLISILYGIINATIVIPVVMSFGNIIYQNARFQPYTPVLIQLTMVSGVIHQLCFSSLSGLPFVVGSVQDAGLIFLSHMASCMVEYCTQQQGIQDDQVILATVTVGLGVATAILGCGLIVIGKCQLAGYVQMLPTCVVAGYLAYIGFFCGKSGLSLMASSTSHLVMDGNDQATDKDDSTNTDSNTGDAFTWSLLIDHWWLVVPGVLGGIFIYGSVRTFQHIAVLPTCIVLLLACFYVGLALVGSSIEEATQSGWIRQAEPAPVWYHTWDYLQFDKVVWSALPPVVLTEVSMLFVVALSSSLDVAAIELELSQPLDYNRELTTVGISNVISGLTGGYTGSYIFSQSIFSLRSGIQSRVAGFALAGCQMLVLITPFPILSYVPNFFYGSLLGMICLDLMVEWLWDFRTKVRSIAEYLIGLSTFGLIQWWGVEYGILAGVAIYIVCRQAGIPVGELKMVTDETEQETYLLKGKQPPGELVEADWRNETEATPLLVDSSAKNNRTNHPTIHES